jgi:hypothetical protein
VSQPAIPPDESNWQISERDSISPPRSRPWWQFTLREVFFLILAVAAMLGYWRERRTFFGRPSPFSDQLDFQQTLAAAGRASGQRCDTWGYSGRSSGGSHRSIKAGEFSLKSVTDPGALMSALHTEMRRQLADAHCESGGGSTGKTNDVLTDFDFDYSYGRNHGVVSVTSRTSTNGSVTISFFVLEGF